MMNSTRRDAILVYSRRIPSHRQEGDNINANTDLKVSFDGGDLYARLKIFVRRH